MPGTSLFALIDDIAALLDDVAVMTKVAAKKTAGVLGDDLALNAEQVAGVPTDRELPVVWAVAVGSAKNKAIIVPAALLISAFAPWAIQPLLMVGGGYLCFEGVEKVAHKLLHKDEAAEHQRLVEALKDPATDILAYEKAKIRGAIRTDFILSTEIIVITLGSVASAAFGRQVSVLCAIATLMTVGVYGLVAGIVKLDDLGLALSRKGSQGLQALGRGILRAAPYMMKGLSIAGTAAMFLVGGGIVLHGIAPLHRLAQAWDAEGGLRAWILGILMPGVLGLVVGALLLLVVMGIKRLRPASLKEAKTKL